MALSGFPAAARRSLGDSQLRANLARATSTIRDKRGRVVAELPDWEELRSSGSAIKDAALLGLADHLTQLESAVLGAGGQVHWAKDGDEACSIVAAVARSHGVDEVVKVKSIATDEIGLNARLAAEGILAVETDLAELIIQLDDDFPSHILVPAIHRNRAEIRDIFRRELGLEDLTDEPEALAEAARLHLRAKFLSARMGVSGANFAVAETGSVCVFESEGNGRMCTTLPEVLVTVMGVEKVVPSWRDMEVFLQLLPRSSTGERMNPYTSVWSGVAAGAAASGGAAARPRAAGGAGLRGPRRRRPARVPPRAARQRARAHACRRGRAPGAALHPLQRVPERVSGLRTGRRARVRIGVSRADRGDPHASARGRRGRCRLAPLRLLALRRVRRGVPGEDRDPAPPDPPPRPRGRLPFAPRPRDPHHEGPLPHLLVTPALRASPEAGPSGEPPAGTRGRRRRGRRRARGRRLRRARRRRRRRARGRRRRRARGRPRGRGRPHATGRGRRPARGRRAQEAHRAGPHDLLGARAAVGVDEVARAARARTRDLPRMVAPHPRARPGGRSTGPTAHSIRRLPHIPRHNAGEQCGDVARSAAPEGGAPRAGAPAARRRREPTSFRASVRPSAALRSPTSRATTAPKTNGRVTRS